MVKCLYGRIFEDGMFPQRHPVQARVNKAAASCAIFGCRLGPRASFRYPPFTSPMFTVHLADVHSAPCIVYNSPYTMSREYTSSCLYSLLTVQHTQLWGHLTFFYIDEASPTGISVNGYYYGIIFQPVFCKDHCYWVLKALTRYPACNIEAGP